MDRSHSVSKEERGLPEIAKFLREEEKKMPKREGDVRKKGSARGTRVPTGRTDGRMDGGLSGPRAEAPAGCEPS